VTRCGGTCGYAFNDTSGSHRGVSNRKEPPERTA
jgi:hypothetical protein